MKPVITLTTDFGTRDYFTGILRGVILQINPDIQIVDITHDIPPFDIRTGAFVISKAHRDFPRGSIHIVVVDPGVGSERRPLLAVSRSGFFLAPDNGVLSYVYEEDGPCQIYEINEKKFFLPSSGNTFHGRDIFAPVAAWLSTGLEAPSFGPAINDAVKFPVSKPTITQGNIAGNIVFIDHFGNLITNIRGSHLPSPDLKHLSLKIGEQTLKGGKRYYQEAVKGEISFTINSSGHIEIFQNQGSASKTLKILLDEKVSLTL